MKSPSRNSSTRRSAPNSARSDRADQADQADPAKAVRGDPVGPAVGGRDPLLRTTILDNGLTVVTEAMSDVASVAVGFWVKVGSRDEPAPLAGASHFLEHLLFKGSPRWDGRAIAEAVDESGGEMNAFTAKEHTAFYLRVLGAQLDTAVSILSDIVWSPALDPEDVDGERQVILEELLLHGDEPDDMVHDVLAATLFPNHPLGREILGDRQTVTAMSVADIRGFHRLHYVPGTVVVAAAGDVDHDALVEQIVSAAPTKATASSVQRTPPGPDVDSRRVVEDDTEQVHIAVGVRAGRDDHPDRYALALLDQVLGGGLSSRLFQEIREQRGLAYSVFSSRASFSDSGVLSVYAGTAPDHADEVLDALTNELDKVAKSGITARELDVAKAHVRGAMVLGLEDSGSRLGRIAHNQVVHGEVRPVGEVLAEFERVTVDDAARVAEDALSQPRAIAIVGPYS